MTSTNSSNLVVGYTTQDHLLLDLDNVSLWKATKIALMIEKDYPETGMGLIVRSSPNHYHMIFDNKMPWPWIVQIIETLCDLGIIEKNYAFVRTFRRDLTLRISDKKGVDRHRPTPSPVRFIDYWGYEEPRYGITKYLRMLGMFNKIDEMTEFYERLNG